MKIDGSYTMKAPRQQVFETLHAPAALRQCLPGCERFEESSPGRYETTLKVGIAGIKGTFTGTVTLANDEPPASYTLSMEGSFSGGFVKGTGDITLAEEGEGTRVSYTGDVQISGALASIGQRLLLPGVRMVANNFFKCMESQIGR